MKKAISYLLRMIQTGCLTHVIEITRKALDACHVSFTEKSSECFDGRYDWTLISDWSDESCWSLRCCAASETERDGRLFSGAYQRCRDGWDSANPLPLLNGLVQCELPSYVFVSFPFLFSHEPFDSFENIGQIKTMIHWISQISFQVRTDTQIGMQSWKLLRKEWY